MKMEKWLFFSVIIAIIALLGIAVVGAGSVYQSVFPMAAPIDCPDLESITAISLIRDNDTSVVVETADFGELLHNISNTQPTRIWSVNDYPTAENYYTMEIDTSEREYRYFIYMESSQVYIESPYEGVYQADQQILELVAEPFKN